MKELCECEKSIARKILELEPNELHHYFVIECFKDCVLCGRAAEEMLYIANEVSKWLIMYEIRCIDYKNENTISYLGAGLSAVKNPNCWMYVVLYLDGMITDDDLCDFLRGKDTVSYEFWFLCRCLLSFYNAWTLGDYVILNWFCNSHSRFVNHLLKYPAADIPAVARDIITRFNFRVI